MIPIWFAVLGSATLVDVIVNSVNGNGGGDSPGRAAYLHADRTSGRINSHAAGRPVGLASDAGHRSACWTGCWVCVNVLAAVAIRMVRAAS